MKLIISADTDYKSKRASKGHSFCCNLVAQYQHITIWYTVVLYTACDASQLHLHPSVVSSPACESAQSMVLWHMKGVLAGHLAEAEPKKTQYNFILQNTTKDFKNLRFLRFLSENICDSFRILLFGSELADRMRPPWATQQASSFSLQ